MISISIISTKIVGEGQLNNAIAPCSPFGSAVTPSRLKRGKKERHSLQKERKELNLDRKLFIQSKLCYTKCASYITKSMLVLRTLIQSFIVYKITLDTLSS